MSEGVYVWRMYGRNARNAARATTFMLEAVLVHYRRIAVSLFGGDTESSGKTATRQRVEVFGTGLITQSGLEEKVPFVSSHHDERRPLRKLGISYVAVVVGGYGDFHLCVSLAA